MPDLTLSDEAASVAADAVLNLLDGGYLRLLGRQDGEAGEIIIGELRFGIPAFGEASAGRATARAMAPSRARASGRLTRFIAFRFEHVQRVYDGTIGTLNADLLTDDLDVQADAELLITRLTYTQPRRA
jgi:hypothetical protein